MSGADCEHLREIAPEVALGIADGEDRAWALEHLDDCPACRARIERLSALADELLLLAPAAEPPGRASRPASPTRSAPAPRRRSCCRRRCRAPGRGRASPPPPAPPARSGSRSATTATSPTPTARRSRSPTASTSTRRRSMLPGGEKVGYVYGYQGRASWVLAVIYDGVADGRLPVAAVTHDGKRMPLRPLAIRRRPRQRRRRDLRPLRRTRRGPPARRTTAARSPTPTCTTARRADCAGVH